MMIAIRHMLFRHISPVPALLLIMSVAAGAQTGVAESPDDAVVVTIDESPDGAVTVTIDGQATTVPADLAARIAGVLQEHAGDSQGLRAAICALVAEVAGGHEDKALAMAIAAVAAFKSDKDSVVVAAIAEGVSACSPAADPQVLLGLLLAVKEVAEEAGVERTVEQQQQLSPTG